MIGQRSSLAKRLLAPFAMVLLLSGCGSNTDDLRAWIDEVKARPGGRATFMRYLSAWVILFGSKFAILEAVAFAFGSQVEFRGALHGVVAIIVVLVVMVLAELFIVRIFHWLGNSGTPAAA